MYLKLKTGKSITNTENNVVLTEGTPIESSPVLFINNQTNIQSSTGYSTRFYILVYWNLETKELGKQPFFVKEIVASEEVVNQFATYLVPEEITEVNIPELILYQLYTYLLSIPLQQINSESGLLENVLDEQGNPIYLFGDWELVLQ
jgi:hypothetical protein